MARFPSKKKPRHEGWRWPSCQKPSLGASVKVRLREVRWKFELQMLGRVGFTWQNSGPIQHGHQILGLGLSSHSTLGFLRLDPVLLTCGLTEMKCRSAVGIVEKHWLLKSCFRKSHLLIHFWSTSRIIHMVHVYGGSISPFLSSKTSLSTLVEKDRQATGERSVPLMSVTLILSDLRCRAEKSLK